MTEKDTVKYACVTLDILHALKQNAFKSNASITY